MRDHPDIEKLRRTGETGSGRYPQCPICGNECETVYRDRAGFFVGCDECIQKGDAWEDPETMN